MKNIFTLFISLFIAFTASSQDFIVLKKGDIIKAIVKEVNPNDVKYVKYDNQNGPIFTVLKSDIISITYENGAKEDFNISSTSNNSDIQISKNTSCGCEIMLNDLPTELPFETATNSCPEGFRLPTRMELECMCEQKYYIGRFRYGEYWTRERFNQARSYTRTFDDCEEEEALIKYDHGVRCVRDIK